MLCTLEDMRKKEVIDISTGERLGYIDDVEIDFLSGSVSKLIIYGNTGFLGMFGKEDDITVHCCDIRVIGSDVILIERKSTADGAELPKKRRTGSESLFR